MQLRSSAAGSRGLLSSRRDPVGRLKRVNHSNAIKHLVLGVGLVACLATVRAELSLKEIRTAADNVLVASFFCSYIIEKDRPTDPPVVQSFTTALKSAADQAIEYLEGNAYPVGAPLNLRWWGSNTAQGQFAYPCLL